MKITALFAVGALLAITGSAGAPPIFHLPKHQDAFFVQDNLVNSRLLQLEAAGTYRQIDVDRTSSTEADRGRWDQDARGAILLHPARDGLRFRSLRSGPLDLVLDRPGALEALPGFAGGIRRFLAATEDEVFSRAALTEMQASPPLVSLDAKAETFSRAELTALARQIDDLVWSERTNTYILSPVPNASPVLLILQDAFFQAQDLPRIRREYGVQNRAAPPFYFARVDARTFARRAGRWKVLSLPGAPPAH